MHRQVEFTVEIYGGELTGKHIHVIRESHYARQDLAFDVGEMVSENGEKKVYKLTVTEDSSHAK